MIWQRQLSGIKPALIRWFTGPLWESLSTVFFARRIHSPDRLRPYLQLMFAALVFQCNSKISLEMIHPWLCQGQFMFMVAKDYYIVTNYSRLCLYRQKFECVPLSVFPWIRNWNIPILPEAFLTFASKSFIGPSYMQTIDPILHVQSMLWSGHARHWMLGHKDIAQHI